MLIEVPHPVVVVSVVAGAAASLAGIALPRRRAPSAVAPKRRRGRSMNAVLTLLLVYLAVGVGAALRFVVDGTIRARVRLTYPLTTTIINVTGSLLLGLLTGIALAHGVPHRWHVVVGTGLLGGYTTFSTSSFEIEAIRLVDDRRYVAALMNGIGMLVLAVTAAAVGIAAGLRT